MANDLPLTLAFLHQKPLEAGRELAAMGSEEAAIFLDAIPIRFAAPTLTAMGAWSASRILSKMSATSATTILNIIDYLDAAAILRHFSISVRKTVLSDLPKKLQRDFETSLAFPDGTVGAHMTTAFMTLTGQHVVGDAIDLIKRSAMVGPEMILVVDADRRLAGTVTALSLLRHTTNTALSEIMDSGIESVSARSKLSAVDAVASWSDYPALPVVSRQKHVIGLLLRKTATCADERHHPSGSQPTTSIVISMLDAFIVSTVGLTQALIATETSTVVKVGNRNE